MAPRRTHFAYSDNGRAACGSDQGRKMSRRAIVTTDAQKVTCAACGKLGLEGFSRELAQRLGIAKEGM